MLIKISITA